MPTLYVHRHVQDHIDLAVRPVNPRVTTFPNPREFGVNYMAFEHVTGRSTYRTVGFSTIGSQAWRSSVGLCRSGAASATRHLEVPWLQEFWRHR
jgi:hypothetical protein